MKQFATTLACAILFICTGGAALAQPINDMVFMSRPIFNAPTGASGTNAGATAENANNPSASCTVGGADNDGDNSSWWWFVADANGSVTIDLDGSSFDTILTVLDGNLAEVGCNDDDPNNGAGDFTSRVENVSVLATGVYFVRVTGYNSDEGDITFSFDGPVSAPPEDTAPLAMPFAGLYPVTTIGATPGGPLASDPAASCVSSDGGNSIYRFFQGTGEEVTFFFEIGAFDTVMTILDNQGNELACNDDGGEGTLSRIDNFPTQQNVEYYIRVVGFGGAEGNGRIRRVDGNTTAGEPAAAPEVAALDAAYPNPFTTHTTLPFVLPQAADVRIIAYDVLGRQVAVLSDGPHAAGPHEVTFEAAGLPSGIYMIRMAVGKTTITRRVTVVR